MLFPPKRKGSRSDKEMKQEKIYETCSCGGEGIISGIHKMNDGTGIPILKCKRCGDTFDAHEDYWIHPKGK